MTGTRSFSSNADHVQAAVAALGDRAARWTYISSMSVYSDDETPNADESSPLHAPARPGDEYEYGAQKVAAEQVVQQLGARVRIIRPGLIAGVGDTSDRFGYWAAAFARAGRDPVLTPAREGRWVQVINVEDVAVFAAGTASAAIVNAIGDSLPFATVVDLVRSATGHTGEVIEADDTWLEAHNVQHWMGERSLPLWLPADMGGLMRRRNDVYHALGGTLRPLDATIASIVADERERGLDRPRRAGLTRAEERELIAALR